ncbi:hypothetical protein [Photobacterium sp. J15]|uniref:hypothetical protein n=1 Tax=Photobacterium sp. J15 TaxID=265901 RepID=UPI0007E385CA|nr:hypothetical protein [Photobacterium sp. J15]
MADNNDLEVAKNVVKALRLEHKDKRLQHGINAVEDACLHLIKKKMPITLETAATFIEENKAKYNGKPARRTVTNDHKGVYQAVVDAYIHFGVKKNEKDRKSSEKGGNSQEQVYIKLLEQKVRHLNNIIKENFKEKGALSVKAMLGQPVDQSGTVVTKAVSNFTTSQIEAIANLFYLIDMTDDFEFVGEGDKRRVISSLNKKPLLSPKDVQAIKGIISRE